jgi:choline dehydrogenase-like flavoprotein
MFNVFFHTRRFRPDNLIALRGQPDWNQRIPGVYENDAWRFQIPSSNEPVEFKFFLNARYWQSGNNISVVPNYGGKFDVGESDVFFEGYEHPDQAFPPAENGRIARLYFEPELNQDNEYDVIVVGSGIGGGIVAEQLADLGRSVLILEAGSLVFPTHVGNLPRRHALNGGIDKNVWSLFYDLQSKNYDQNQDSKFGGGFGLNLGGRSIFWGGYIPRMSAFETNSWPQTVVEYLNEVGYERAESLLRKSHRRSDYQANIEQVLRQRFPGQTVSQLSLSVGNSEPESLAIPSGIFSTADLLMESRLTAGQFGKSNLRINLNHPVVNFRRLQGGKWQVHAFDRISTTHRAFRSKSVIVAAGSMQTPAVFQRSALNADNGLVGQGITDHPIFFAHFAIPNGSILFERNSAAKAILQNRNSTALQHRYIAFADVGSDISLSRFIDPQLYRAHLDSRGDRMLAEVVFQFCSPLLEQNYVRTGSGPIDRLNVSMAEVPISPNEWQEISAFCSEIVAALGGESLNGSPIGLSRAPIGGVAHEAGSMRMGPDGVVDENLRFYGQENLYVCDLSVFPNSPAANPTLTLAALALRLAEHVNGTL